MNKKFFLLGLVTFFALPTIVSAFSCAPLVRAFNYALHDKHMLRSCTTGRFLPVAGHFEALKIVRDRIMFNVQSTMASKAIMQQNNEMARLVELSLKQHALEGTTAALKPVAQKSAALAYKAIAEQNNEMARLVGLSVKQHASEGALSTVSRVAQVSAKNISSIVLPPVAQAPSRTLSSGAQEILARTGLVGVGIGTGTALDNLATVSEVTPQLIQAGGAPIAKTFTDTLSAQFDHGANAAQNAVVNASQIFTGSAGAQASGASSSSLSKIVTDTFTHHSYAICGGAVLTAYLGYCWHKKVSPLTHAKRALAGLFYGYTPSRPGEGFNSVG